MLGSQSMTRGGAMGEPDRTGVFRLGARPGLPFRTAGSRTASDARGLYRTTPPYDLCRRMRASFYTAGLLLARMGRAEVPLPGGCSIGTRPVDFHMRGFAALGAEVTTEHGYMKAGFARRARGTQFYVPRSSVGTTINLMMVASTARGTTVLQNAAREPEVVDTAVFLNLMGAEVRGAGTDTVPVGGVATRGDVIVEGLIPEHFQALLTKLQEAGAEAVVEPDGVRVRMSGDLQAIDGDTAPHPGFATASR